MAYPASVDTLVTDAEAGKDDFTGKYDSDSGFEPGDVGYHAELHNTVATAVNAIEKELGIEPSGAASDLTARLKAIDEAIKKAEEAGVTTIFGRTGKVAAQVGDYAVAQVTGLVEALEAKQPIDADLTAIAALATTEYGRSFLKLANAAAGRTLLELGTAATEPKTAFEVAGTAAAAVAAEEARAKAAEEALSGKINLDAKDMGAKGDGVTDDAAAINAAITTLVGEGGGVLYFPAGTYLVKSNILLKSKVSLLGAGILATQIKAEAGVTTAPLTGTSGNAVTDLSIRDMTVDGNASAFGTNIYGINITKGTRVRVSNVRIQNTYHIGVYTTECTDFTLDNCLISNTGITSASPNAVHVLKGTRSRIAFNTIIDWGNSGNGRAIYVAESPGAEVVDNTIADPGNTDHSHMISLDASSHRCVVSDNMLDSSEYTGETRKCVGISVINCNDTLISSNRILEPKQDKGSLECIQVDGTSARATVTGNHCEYGDDNGITAWGAGEHVVTGNYVMFCSHFGISVNSSNCTVVGNTVKNSSQHPTIEFCSGIGVFTGCINNVIVGNRCYDDQAEKTQVYGYYEAGTADKNTVIGNDFTGNKEAAMKVVGANSIFGANQGVTPRKGEVEVHDIGTASFADSAALVTPINGTLQFRSDTMQLSVRTGVNIYTQLMKDKIATLVDAAAITPGFANGNHFILAAKGNRTINNVGNRVLGATVTFDIKNETGGAMVTTWNEAYKFAGAWVDPANGKSRTVTFYCYDGTNWKELCRSAADIS